MTKQRPIEHVLESQAEKHLRQVLPSTWVLRPIHPDYGSDFWIEYFLENGSSTSKIIFIQSKATSSFSRTRNGVYLDIEVKDLIYLEEHPVPVVLTLYSKEDTEIRWIFVHKYIEKILDVEKPEWREQTKIRVNFPDITLKESVDEVIRIFTDGPEYLARKLLDKSTDEIDILFSLTLDRIKDYLLNYEVSIALKMLDLFKTDNWDRSSNKIKFRILSYQAKCKLYLEHLQEAAKLYIEAEKYNPENDDAITNVAKAYTILGQTGKAKEYANRVLAKNPSNVQAYSVMIANSPVNKPLKDIISEIPDNLSKEAIIAVNISSKAGEQGLYEDQKKWMEKTVEYDTSDNPFWKMALAELVTSTVFGKDEFKFKFLLPEETKSELLTAIELVTKAWEKITDTELRKVKLKRFMSRIYANLILDNLDEVNADLDFIFRMEPSDPIVIRNQAVILADMGKNKEAIVLLEKIRKEPDPPDTSIILTQLLVKEREFDKAVNVIEEFFQSNNKRAKELDESAQRLQVQLYMELGDYNEAERISDAMVASEPSNFFYLVDSAKVKKEVNKDIDAKALLNRAVEYVATPVSTIQLSDLASTFYLLGEFTEAASFYERIPNAVMNDKSCLGLILSHYHDGNDRKALEFCQKYREIHGTNKKTSEIERTIFTSIGDLEKAVELCKDYLETQPDDPEIKLELAILYFFMGKTVDLESVLRSDIDISNLSTSFIFEFVKLLAINNKGQKAFQIIYDTVMSNFDNRDVHVEYCYFFISNEKKFKELLDAPEIVQIDSAVLIEDNLGKKSWFVIEKRADNKVALNIYSTNHPIASKLLGRSKEEVIVISEDDRVDNSIKIIDIVTKYVYWVNNIANNLNIWFPDVKEIKMVNIGTFDDISSGKSIIFDILRKSAESMKQLGQFYREKKLPVGIFSTLLKRDAIETWKILVSNPELGVRCCSNRYDEIYNATRRLQPDHHLVIDIISLLTIHLFKVENTVPEGYKKLGIAHSTIDLIRNHLVELKGMKVDGYATAGIKNDKITGLEITPGNIADQISFFENMLKWVDKNCKILICNAALDMNRHERNEIQNLFGKSFIDTVLIASERGRVLYSDDHVLRLLAERTYGIKSVWTQAVFKDCLDRKIIDQATYSGVSVKLALSNYSHTHIDASILMESARLSEWGSTGIYVAILEYFIKTSTEVNAVSRIAAEFLLKLCENNLQSDQLKNLLSSLLSAINSGKNGDLVIELLKKDLIAQPTDRYSKKLISFVIDELIPFIDDRSNFL